MARSFNVIVKGIIAACQKADRSAAARQIDIGQRCHEGIRARVLDGHNAGARRKLRAEVVGTIAAELKQAGCAPQNISRSVGVGQVAILFKESEAKKMQFSILVQFVRFLKRDPKKEEWSIKPKVEDQAQTLWTSVVAGEVDDVRAAVDQVLCVVPRTPRPAKPKRSPADTFHQFIKTAETKHLGLALTGLRTNDPDAFAKLLKVLMVLAKQPEQPTAVTPTIEPATVPEYRGRRKAA